MPTGPKGEKRPVSPTSAAVTVGQIATKQIRETNEPDPQALHRSIFSMDNLYVPVDTREIHPPFTAEELATVMERVKAPLDFSDGRDITPDDISTFTRELLKKPKTTKK